MRVGDLDQVAPRRGDRAAVAHLPAGFPVERRFGRQQFDLFAFQRFLFAATVAVNRQHRRFAVEAVVADKADRPVELNLGFHADRFARLAPAVALRVHQPFKLGLVRGHALAA